MISLDIKLAFFERLMKKYPAMRFGQLLCSAADYSTLYCITDDALINHLSKLYKVEIPTESDLEIPEKEEVVVTEELNPRSFNKGRIYVHRGDEVKSIKKEDLESYTFLGFKLGKKDR